MSELAQSVTQLGELIPTVPERLGELISSAREVDTRTDALSDSLTRADELLEQHGAGLQEALGRLSQTIQHAQEQVAGALSQLAGAAQTAREASDAWTDGTLRESTAALDGALDAARDRLAAGADQMDEARELIDAEMGPLRAKADEIGAEVQKGVEALVTGMGEVSQAIDAAEAGLQSDAERIREAIDALVEGMANEARALVESATASRDAAAAEIREAADGLDSMRTEAMAEVDQKVREVAQAMSDAISRLHSTVDNVNAQLAQAAGQILPIREEYERLSEAFGWSEQPLNTMIGEVRKAADQAGIPFA